MRTYKLQHKFSNYFGNYNSSSKSGMSSIHACPVFNLPSPLHISIIFHQVPDISRKCQKIQKGWKTTCLTYFQLPKINQNLPKLQLLGTHSHPLPSPAIASLLSSKLSDGLLQIGQIFTRHAVQGLELQCQATAETLHHGHLMQFAGAVMVF